MVERMIICLLWWWWFRFAPNPPFLFSHSIEWHISEEATGTREGSFRSAYLGRDQGMVSFPLLLVSHFNHLSCVYEKIPKITKMNLKPQDFAGSEGYLCFFSLLFPFSCPSPYTHADSSVFWCFSFHYSGPFHFNSWRQNVISRSKIEVWRVLSLFTVIEENQKCMCFCEIVNGFQGSYSNLDTEREYTKGL